ncbi:hypothetical protein RF11_10888 [Thelohanellus kitauei]|uniref:Uncharacterized protein n=1 Tax=Thelohanellus kitauei TaxID=669202 RepID=A0A0C2M921_THEKT|nr:hypothetical protein RF11_10888 [Thelohanellus kitauei]
MYSWQRLIKTQSLPIKRNFMPTMFKILHGIDEVLHQKEILHQASLRPESYERIKNKIGELEGHAAIGCRYFDFITKNDRRIMAEFNYIVGEVSPMNFFFIYGQTHGNNFPLIKKRTTVFPPVKRAEFMSWIQNITSLQNTLFDYKIKNHKNTNKKSNNPHAAMYYDLSGNLNTRPEPRHISITSASNTCSNCASNYSFLVQKILLIVLPQIFPFLKNVPRDVCCLTVVLVKYLKNSSCCKCFKTMRYRNHPVLPKAA